MLQTIFGLLALGGFCGGSVACGVSRMAAPRMIELNGLNDLMTTADQTNLLLVFSIKRFGRPAQPPDARQSGQCLADRSLPDPRETTRTQFSRKPQDHWRPQKAPESPRRLQEAQGSSRGAQKAPESPRRLQPQEAQGSYSLAPSFT